jgi:5-methyltetrahydrofolate--homocysteine methyltransferase
MLETIIGERLNSSVKTILEAMNCGDEDFIVDLIKKQELYGAEYLDINTAMCENEFDKMKWVVDLLCRNSQCIPVIDSLDLSTITSIAPLIKDRQFIINSVNIGESTDEAARLAGHYNAGIIAMPIDDYGIEAGIQSKLTNADKLINIFVKNAVPLENIYVDAVTYSLFTNVESANMTFETIRQMKKTFPDIKVICGISNVSYGLPKRIYLNAAYLSIAISCGLDAAITDVCSPEIRAAIYASKALCGYDEYCYGYVSYVKKNKKLSETK